MRCVTAVWPLDSTREDFRGIRAGVTWPGGHRRHRAACEKCALPWRAAGVPSGHRPRLVGGWVLLGPRLGALWRTGGGFNAGAPVVRGTPPRAGRGVASAGSTGEQLPAWVPPVSRRCARPPHRGPWLVASRALLLVGGLCSGLRPGRAAGGLPLEGSAHLLALKGSKRCCLCSGQFSKATEPSSPRRQAAAPHRQAFCSLGT